MTAKLATVDEYILAGIEDGCGVSDGSLIVRGSSDKQQARGVQFGCGYLSPLFITDPERTEVVFENAYILIHEGTISSRNPHSEPLAQCEIEIKQRLVVLLHLPTGYCSRHRPLGLDRLEVNFIGALAA